VPSYKTRLRGLNGSPFGAGDTAVVNSGNRPVSIVALTLLGSLWAAAAGDAYEDGTEAMYFAPEVAAQFPAGVECGESMQFERIRLTGGAAMVDFDWKPHTGELSFHMSASAARVMLPERFLTAAAVSPGPSCESR
jgi:hypothetical protein